jgi:hypothetical protein
MIMRIFLRSLLAVLAVSIVGCSSEVAVSPRGSTIASFKHNPITGTMSMSGDVDGDIMSAFHAANNALDALGYFRVGQDTTKKDAAYVYARGVKDVYVTVGVSPSQQAGQVTMDVSLSSGSLPDTQAIFSAILDQLQSSGSRR